jgi:two-component system, chemotaxis family, CheB/CheR fusion protein
MPHSGPAKKKIAQSDVPECPVVGIGTSAGGIEAMQAFLSKVPPASGIAYIMVPHLDPTQQSHMAQVLSRSTTLPVTEAKESEPLLPDHVYIIPPDRYLSLNGGFIHLSKPVEARGHRRPIDLFFNALAQDQKERAICVVLSGTGSNGSIGLKAVKAAGGLVIAQDPATAGHTGMPDAAIATGAVDYVLPPEKIPEALLRYTRQPYYARAGAVAEVPQESQLDNLLTTLIERSNHDFRSYKPKMLLRRIHRRMGLHALDDLNAYLALVRDNAEEAKALTRDLTITVSSFFRDPDAWKALRASVIEPLVRAAPARATIRVWVPACATGEEAYSLAMLLLDEAERAHKLLELKVFATDTVADVLELARIGVYGAGIDEDIPEELLRQFFAREKDSYRVNRVLREAVVFAPQNALQDPPFAHLHLISCRNLLIYLEPAIQKKLISLFHFALREDGFLFLGSAENLTGQEHQFASVSSKWRIYKRVGRTRHDLVEIPLVGGPTRLAGTPLRSRSDEATHPRASDLARDVLLDEFVPASVLIDRHSRALYFHGDTDPYLRQPAGEPTQDILALARDGLRAKLRSAVQRARDNHAAYTTGASMRRGGQAASVRIKVRPLKAGRDDDGMLVVSFLEGEASGGAQPEQTTAIEEPGSTSEELEAEVRMLRQDLRSTIEQMEGSNEELKASNEEIMSMNEELQSANEELETSKEELQSLNEELNTVNAQLQAKLEELEERTNDLNNLLVSTHIATLFLDQQLRIRWFTPAMKDLMELLPTDIGRPANHFAHKIVNGDFLASARQVLRTLAPSRAEVRSEDGRWYMRQVLPYRAEQERIGGIVITFVDISDIKLAEQDLRAQKDLAEQIVDTVQQPLVLLDGKLLVQSANRAFFEAFQTPREDAIGRSLYEFASRQWDIPALRNVLEQQLGQAGDRSDFELEHEFRTIGHRVLKVRGRRLDNRQGVLLAIEDITERRQWEKHQQMLVAELNHRVKNSLLTVQAIATQTLKASATPEDFRERFQGRVLALARGHDLLVRSQWEPIGLGEMIHDVLRPFGRALLDHVSPRCGAARLDPQSALALNLIFYELATNAAKHGALSVPEGRVEVDCEPSENGGHTKLIWNESGGPPVSIPNVKGFGTTLIERSARHDLGGQATLDFRAEGLRATITIPLKE